MLKKILNWLNSFIPQRKQLVYAMNSLENITDGVYWVDDTGRIIYVNEAACRMLGYSKAELLQMTVGEIDARFEIQNSEKYREFYTQMLDKDMYSFLSAHRHKDGRLIPVEIITASIKQEGERDIGLAIVRNIEQRVLIEEKLRETNSRLVHELQEHEKTTHLLRKANRELEISANLDQLTNTWNRRWLLNQLEKLSELVHQQKSKLTLLLLDLDNFKQVNDTYGHLVGDQVLVEFAELIKTNIRHSDSLSRWGGEEFIILILNTTAAQALEYGERLRSLVEKHSFRHIGSLTVSIGIAELGKDEDINSLLKRVDEALYRAKNNRNEVVSSEQPS